MKKMFLTGKLIATLFPVALLGQNYADCTGAHELNLIENRVFTFEKLNGYGDKKELPQANATNSIYFNGEHNVAWLKFSLAKDVEMELDITPLNVNDDLDFTIFEYDGKDFCNELQEKIQLPIRTNLTRNNDENGVTGLKSRAISNFAKPGKGINFSKSLLIKQDKQYFLVVDNISGQGGFTLNFNLLYGPFIGGVVTEKVSGLVLDPNLVLKNNCNGDVILNSKAHKSDGTFRISATPIDCDHYQLSVLKKGYMYESYTLSNESILAGNATNLKIKLEKLSEGQSYKIRNLNFEPGSDALVDKADIALHSLYVLMAENPTMRIKIEGHVNWLGNPYESTKENKSAIKLSRDRARKVMNYLISKEIEANRMEADGLGATKLLIKSPKNAKEEEENRRVEIKILNF